MQLHQNSTAHGALAVFSPSAREIVVRRMMMRAKDRAPEARRAAAEWLAENGTQLDRIEANRFLSGRWVNG